MHFKASFGHTFLVNTEMMFLFIYLFTKSIVIKIMKTCMLSSFRFQRAPNTKWSPASPWLHVGNSAIRNWKILQGYPGQCLFTRFIQEISTNPLMNMVLQGCVDQPQWRAWPAVLQQVQWHYLRGIWTCSMGNYVVFSKKVSSSNFGILSWSCLRYFQ